MLYHLTIVTTTNHQFPQDFSKLMATLSLSLALSLRPQSTWGMTFILVIYKGVTCDISLSVKSTSGVTVTLVILLYVSDYFKHFSFLASKI